MSFNESSSEKPVLRQTVSRQWNEETLMQAMYTSTGLRHCRQFATRMYTHNVYSTVFTPTSRWVARWSIG